MNKVKPTVSLIISTYNWTEALKLSLLSVAQQTHLPDEVIVADDGSREETKQLIDRLKSDFPCSLVHVWHEDKGFRLAAIRNKTIAIAKGDYIIQMDGDIILEKHYISDHLEFANRGFFTSGSRVRLKEEYTKEVLAKSIVNITLGSKNMDNFMNGLRCRKLRNYYRLRYKKNKPIYVKGCNMAFWRDDLIAVNGYNEAIEGWGAEDSEIAVRLMNLGIRRQFIKFGGVQFHIYHHENSRDKEKENYDILYKTQANGVTCCEKGIEQYLDK